MKRTITAALVAGLATAATPALSFAGPGHRPPSFADLDADGDGVVSSEEFVAPAVERFAELDADGNGTVSSDEFTVKLLERFEEIDTDDDGSLTRDELRAGRPRRHR
jgi:Ca2+-binding EF-hand superfamily protein